MRRKDAIQLGEDVLRALETGRETWPLSLVREVYVFGSVARGALTPNDLDLCVEHDSDKQWVSHAIRAMSRGRDSHSGMRRTLRGARRSCEIYFNGRGEVDFEMTLLWQRGESFDLAVHRLRAIPADPTAVRAVREAMLPQFEGLERWMPRDDRHRLHDAVQAGAIAIERLTLEDGEARRLAADWELERRWSPASPLLRAARAVAAYWEGLAVDPSRTRLHGEPGWMKAAASHHAGFAFRYLGDFRHALAEPGAVEWLEVAHPTRTQPLAALRVTPVDQRLLADLQL